MEPPKIAPPELGADTRGGAHVPYVSFDPLVYGAADLQALSSALRACGVPLAAYMTDEYIGPRLVLKLENTTTPDHGDPLAAITVAAAQLRDTYAAMLRCLDDTL